MHFIASSTLLLAVAGFASAQVQYSIDPSSVPLATRQQWCDSQITSCPLICLQEPGNSASTTSNNCNPNQLTYSCTCSDGISPNASEYTQTLPYFICTEWGTQCVQGCGSDNTCAYNCRAQHPCGAQDPKRVNTTTSSSSMSATGSATSTANYNGFGGAATTTAASSNNNNNNKKNAATALNIGQSYGLAIVFSGLFAGFALML